MRQAANVAKYGYGGIEILCYIQNDQGRPQRGLELGASEQDLDIWEQRVLVEGTASGPEAECASCVWNPVSCGGGWVLLIDYFAQGTLAQYNRLDGLTQKFSSSRFWSLDVQDQAFSRIVSSEVPLLSLQIAVFSLCFYFIFSPCIHVLISSSYEDTGPD